MQPSTAACVFLLAMLAATAPTIVTHTSYCAPYGAADEALTRVTSGERPAPVTADEVDVVRGEIAAHLDASRVWRWGYEGGVEAGRRGCAPPVPINDMVLHRSVVDSTIMQLAAPDTDDAPAGSDDGTARGSWLARIPAVVDHWMPTVGCGFALFTHYQHLPFVVVSAVHELVTSLATAAGAAGSGHSGSAAFATTGSFVFDSTRAPDVVAAAYVWLTPAAIAWALRLMGVSPLAAVAAAALMPVINDQSPPDDRNQDKFLGYGIGIHSYTEVGHGLWTQLFAVPFLFCALGHATRAMAAVNRVLRVSAASSGGPEALSLASTVASAISASIGHALVAGVCLGVALLSHMFYGYVAAMSVVLLAMPWDGFGSGWLRRTLLRALPVGVVGVSSFCVAAYFIVPFAMFRSAVCDWEHRSWKFDSVGLPWASRALITGNLFDHAVGMLGVPVVSGLVAAGMYVALSRASVLGNDGAGGGGKGDKAKAAKGKTAKGKAPQLSESVQAARDREQLADAGITADAVHVSQWALACFWLWFVLFAGRRTFGPLLDVVPLLQEVHLHRFVGAVQVFGVVLAAVALDEAWRRWPWEFEGRPTAAAAAVSGDAGDAAAAAGGANRAKGREADRSDGGGGAVQRNKKSGRSGGDGGGAAAGGRGRGGGGGGAAAPRSPTATANAAAVAAKAKAKSRTKRKGALAPAIALLGGTGQLVLATFVLVWAVVWSVQVGVLDDGAQVFEREGLSGDQMRDIAWAVGRLRQLPPGRVYFGGLGWHRPAVISALQNSGLDIVGPEFHTMSFAGDWAQNLDPDRGDHYRLFNVRYVVAPKGSEARPPEFLGPISEVGDPFTLFVVEDTVRPDGFGGSLGYFMPAVVRPLLPRTTRRHARSIGGPTDAWPWDVATARSHPLADLEAGVSSAQSQSPPPLHGITDRLQDVGFEWMDGGGPAAHVFLPFPAGADAGVLPYSADTEGLPVDDGDMAPGGSSSSDEAAREKGACTVEFFAARDVDDNGDVRDGAKPESVETCVPAEFGDAGLTVLEPGVLLRREGRIVAAEPFDACEDLTNAAELAGAVATASRGVCPFVDKIARLQAAGAAAVAILDTSNSEAPAAMAARPGDPPVSVPSVTVPLATKEAVSRPGGRVARVAVIGASRAPPAPELLARVVREDVCVAGCPAGGATYSAKVEVDASAAHEPLDVVLKVNAHPFWQCTVDGEEAHVTVVIPHFMAVRIPGEHRADGDDGLQAHTVSCSYQTPEWKVQLMRASWAFAAVAFCVGVVLAWWAERRDVRV